MKSVMTKDFSRVAETEIQRSTFDRSHGLKTAFDSGYLVPIELQEIVPSDTVDMDVKVMARLAPVVTAVMDNVFIDLHAFFIPSRLVWNNFTKMMGERKNPNDSIDYLVPQVELRNMDGTAYEDVVKVGSLADYLGVPVQMLSDGNGSIKVSHLPFRAYQKVWDDWFRDENLQDSVIQTTEELGDGLGNTDADVMKWLTLRKRGKRYDYFTSCLPWPQKGEGVNLPLGDYADVRFDGAAGTTYDFSSEGNSTIGSGHIRTLSGGSPENLGNGVLRADLSDATAATINSLRMAFQLQRLCEADARGGTRYVEIIRNHFKTICPDARLQRSEFLGSSSIPVVFSPIAQTSATTDASPQGNLAATAHAYGTLKFHKSFSEHGYLMILASVRCDLNYQQGIDRMWSRRSRYDFYWPTLAHLGEQAVLNKEIFAQGNAVVDEAGNVIDDQPFGYQERYAEMRYNPSRITGKMRSGVDGSLDVWHLAQNFEDLPVLSPEFIEDDPPLNRVLAVTEGEPQVIADFYLGQRWTRPLPVYSIPGLIDHF